MTTRTSDPTVSNTILRQLGGHRFLVMTGARDMHYDDRSLTMRLPKAAKSIKWVKIALTDADLYELVGFNRKGTEIDATKRDDVHVENLRESFESLTGLRVSL